MNKHNVVNFSNKIVHYQLCKFVLSSLKYAQEIDANSVVHRNFHVSKICMVVSLHIPQVQFHPSSLNCPIKTCVCIGYVPGTNEKNTMFSVAATKDDSSIILLKGMNFFSEDSQLYNLLEYFENVDQEYVRNYEHY